SKQFRTIGAVMSSKRGPFAKIKSGNVTIPIYRVGNKGYTEFRVVWYDADRKRRQKAFADEAEARKQAGSINATLMGGDIKAVNLTEQDRFVYLDAVNALIGLDTPLNDAAKAYAGAVKRLSGVPLAEAVNFYVKHNAGLESRTVSEVVQELIKSKRSPA